MPTLEERFQKTIGTSYTNLDTALDDLSNSESMDHATMFRLQCKMMGYQLQVQLRSDILSKLHDVNLSLLRNIRGH